LIMLMAGVIMTVGLGFNWLVKEHIKSSEGLKNKAEAILKARSAYDTLIYFLLNGKVTRHEIVLAGIKDLTALKSIPLNGKEISLTEGDGIYIRVRDTNGLLSLARVNSLALEKLIRQVGQVENPAIVVESLMDWTDTDDLARANGAEKLYYQSRQSIGLPRNYALQYKEELAFIRGLDRSLYLKLEPYLTLLPATGFNPNTAADDVLKARLDLSDESLGVLKNYMSQGGVVTEDVLFSLTGTRIRSIDFDLNYFPSRLVEITVRAGAPRSLYTIKAGVSLLSASYSPYTVLFWQEE